MDLSTGFTNGRSGNAREQSCEQAVHLPPNWRCYAHIRHFILQPVTETILPLQPASARVERVIGLFNRP
jgi:hypothetical protein